MKLKLLFAASGVAVTAPAILGGILLMAAVVVFHLGPPGIKAGEDRILSSVLLTNGNKLFLVAHKTGDLIDAYKVSLFRVDGNTNVFVAWLGYEDGYWWGASLWPDLTGTQAQIRAFGLDAGVYSLNDGYVTWTDTNMPPVPSYRIDGVKVLERIPPAILVKP